MHETGSVIT
ncbi:hypothetical protein AZE42_14053, partial [Rhizopogon vesiculosus]